MISDACKNLLEESIFEKIVPLIMKHKALNLAAGSPQWDSPVFLRDCLSKTAYLNENLYGMVGGHPALLKVLAERYRKVFDRQIDEQKEIVVGEGGTGLLSHSFLSLVNEGEEIVTFEPYFVGFKYDANLVKGAFKTLVLEPPSEKNGRRWSIDFDKFEQLFSEKTRILAINSPHNPCGKVFSLEELQKIAEIVKKFPKVTVVSDEVYENFLFGKEDLPRMANLLWDRTLTIFTTGKVFATTGWRIGYAFGPQKIVECVKASIRGFTFCANRPCQYAYSLAYPLAEQEYLGAQTFFGFVSDYVRKNKSVLAAALCDHKYIELYESEGGFFTVCSIEKLARRIPRKYFYLEEKAKAGSEEGPFSEEELAQQTDFDFSPGHAAVLWLVKEKGLAPLPAETFYNNEKLKPFERKGKHFIRISLCITHETMEKAALALKDLNSM